MRRLILFLMLLLPIVASADMEAHFLDVGHGDCAIIICDGEAMIVDGGDAKSSDKVYSAIKALGVEELKFAVATHPQADHVGGLASIFHAATVRAVYAPVTEHPLDRFTMLVDKAALNDVPVLVPTAGDTLRLGDAQITVLSSAMEAADENDMSIVLRIDYGSTSFLLCGDASTAVEKKLLRSGAALDADVIKVAHHGSKSATSAEFLDAVRPRYAIISCSSRYDNPDKEVVDAISAAGATIIRTDVNGDITVKSDGQRVSCTAERYYIGNTNSKIYHRMACSSVEKMKANNKITIYTIDQAEQMAYRPCKNCSP